MYIMNEDEIRRILSNGLVDCEVELQIEGNKVMARMVGDVFEGLSRVKRQQLVYNLLDDKISSGEIHALSMSCLTRPESNK